MDKRQAAAWRHRCIGLGVHATTAPVIMGYGVNMVPIIVGRGPPGFVAGEAGAREIRRIPLPREQALADEDPA
jgi:hypothetical protein